MNFIPKVADFKHQLEYRERDAHKRIFALFWEQGCAKTKPVIDNAAILFQEGEINGVLVVAPDGVDRNWLNDELPEHLIDSVAKRSMTLCYRTAQTVRQTTALKLLTYHEGLSWLFMSYDAFCTKAGMKAAALFLKTRRCMFVLDEASNIKNPTSKRTRILDKASVHGKYKRILEGTPVPNSPFDIFAPIRWLDSNFWMAHGMESYSAFKNNFGVWQKIALPGRPDRWDPDKGKMVPAFFPVLKEYKNLHQLYELVQKVGSRYVKDEVLDLPPKLYTKRYFHMNQSQQKVYTDLKRTMFADLGEKKRCTDCGGTGTVSYEGYDGGCPICDGSGMVSSRFVTAEIAIKRMLRFQQITCGYVPADNPDPEDEGENLVPLGNFNPRLDACMELIQEAPRKFIVWARFRKDIDLIMEACAQAGVKVARYDGACTDAELDKAKHDFQKVSVEDGGPKGLIANPAKGATGLTLHAAKLVIYFSNSFNLRHRLQSEDRAHRAGMDEEPVLYADLIALQTDDSPTIDGEIVFNLRGKFEISSIITGDKLKKWI